MLYRINQKLKRLRYNAATRHIWQAPPRPAGNGPGILLSLVSRHDVTMYLVAVNALHRFLPDFRIVILNDGSLDAALLQALRRQLPGIDIIERDVIAMGRIPRDLMWERLVLSLTLSQSGYVIQLDSDTITRARPDAVLTAIADRRGFIQATCETPEIIPAADAARWAQTQDGDFIQYNCERLLGDLPGHEALRYVHGSAGFYGVPQGALTLADAENLFFTMQDLAGPRMLEWGAEQFAANFLVANLPGATALPYPDYASYMGQADIDASLFLHFIGSFRFDNGVYARLSRQVIADLSAG